MLGNGSVTKAETFSPTVDITTYSPVRSRFMPLCRSSK